MCGYREQVGGLQRQGLGEWVKWMKGIKRYKSSYKINNSWDITHSMETIVNNMVQAYLVLQHLNLLYLTNITFFLFYCCLDFGLFFVFFFFFGNTIFKMDYQQGHTIQHRKFCPMLCGSLGRRGVQGKISSVQFSSVSSAFLGPT